MVKFGIIGKQINEDDIEMRVEVEGDLKTLSQMVSQSMISYPEVLEVLMNAMDEYNNLVLHNSSQN